MARFAVGLVFGVVVGVVGGAALSIHAAAEGGPLSDAADETSAPTDVVVKPLPTPRAYLYATYPWLAPRLDCMIRGESSWNPNAHAGPYVGLAQFDYPTWLETPTGKAGASRTDPYASIDALAWGTQHLGYGRWPVTSRRC